MRIDNLTINIGAGITPSPFALAALASVFARTPSAEGTQPHPQPAGAPTELQAPAIGQYWSGQGGIYLGLAAPEDGLPQGHLVLATDAPDDRRKWAAAVEWAKTVTTDGHTDFRLPTRYESALIYANARGDLVNRDEWHWTGTQYSASSAFNQYFNLGNQLSHDKSYEGRARAVRRLTA